MRLAKGEATFALRSRATSTAFATAERSSPSLERPRGASARLRLAKLAAWAATSGASLRETLTNAPPSSISIQSGDASASSLAEAWRERARAAEDAKAASLRAAPPLSIGDAALSKSLASRAPRREAVDLARDSLGSIG